MNQDINRAKRPKGFKTMAILGYISEGLGLAVYPLLAYLEFNEGHILSGILMIFFFFTCIPAIVGIFMFSERKSILALNLIRIYLWILIPLELLYSLVNIAETGEVAIGLVSGFFGLVLGLLIALYWQQKSHTEYLRSFDH